MNLNTIAFKRRNILGELYKQCDAISTIPVYMNDTTDEPIGTVEETVDHFADAFLFHLPDNICKKLSNNSYDVGIDYDFTDKKRNSKNDRIKINHIILALKRGAEPIPRRNGSLSTARANRT
jgi:hypothetical protein